ncbi:unnamed protein product [Schistocephalus solidus]|uniref:Uncharacterized protein n=1 Tax=Schistocephalus solidus TaxID=70667 RepID=A0A3P7EC14_SCHSO|nr:unnamed protein product [Schistocephalus solidus]
MRKNKAPREDGIPSEIYKSCVDILAPWLHEQAWRDEVIPDDWDSGILVPVHKKGDNYRGISLIDVAVKYSLLSVSGDSSVCVALGRGPTKPDSVLGGYTGMPVVELILLLSPQEASLRLQTVLADLTSGASPTPTS